MADHNIRTVLRALGIGDWNATMLTPYLFMTPATTDPGMGQVMTLVGALQETLNDMGAQVPEDGVMDARTAMQLRRITGPDWPRMTWYQIVQAVTSAREQGMSMIPRSGPPATPRASRGAAVSGLGLSVPDVPGGFLTIAAVIGGIYLYTRKHKARS